MSPEKTAAGMPTAKPAAGGARSIFSIVLPTHNRLPCLRQALGALDAQELPPLEIIVIDDGSTDGTAQFLAKWADAMPDRRRVITGAGRGPATARNLGIRAAAGEIVAMTDDDCLPEPGWLPALGAALSDPAIAGAGGRTLPLQPDNLFSRYQETFSIGQPHRDGETITFVITSNAAFRRAALEAVGGFDESFPFAAEDVDLSRRLRAAGFALAYAPEARIRHRNITDWIGFLRVAYKTGQGEALLERRGAGWYKLLRTGWWGRRLGCLALVPFHARRLRRDGLPAGDAWRFAVLSALDQAARFLGVLSQWRRLVRSE